LPEEALPEGIEQRLFRRLDLGDFLSA